MGLEKISCLEVYLPVNDALLFKKKFFHFFYGWWR